MTDSSSKKSNREVYQIGLIYQGLKLNNAHWHGEIRPKVASKQIGPCKSGQQKTVFFISAPQISQ